MEFTPYILFVFGAGLAALGWFARELWDVVKALKEQVQQLELKISAEYVRYDRLQDALKPIMDSLTEIKNTLSHKMDK
jgi:septation ring formation regulator EzrA